MKNIRCIVARQDGERRMHVVGHHAPRDENVALLVEEEQSIFHDNSNFRPRKRTGSQFQRGFVH